MSDLRVVRGQDFTMDGRGFKQPTFGPGEVMTCAFFPPNIKGQTNIVVYNFGAPPAWRSAWISKEPGGDPLPGNVLVDAKGKPLVPGQINGVSQGMDPVAINVSVGPAFVPQGFFSVSPVVLLPGPQQMYWLNIQNTSPNPNVPGATTFCYVKGYPVQG